MKITPSINNSIIDTGTTARGTRQADSTASGGRPTVDLSPAARQLASLHNADNDINMAQIEKIQQAIANGQLKINPEHIADALLASARELLK